MLVQELKLLTRAWVLTSQTPGNDALLPPLSPGSTALWGVNTSQPRMEFGAIRLRDGT